MLDYLLNNRLGSKIILFVLNLHGFQQREWHITEKHSYQSHIAGTIHKTREKPMPISRVWQTSAAGLFLSKLISMFREKRIFEMYEISVDRLFGTFMFKNVNISQKKILDGTC